MPSSAIGETVLRELKELDEVAYIRFASVYRQFADLDDLRRAVEGLRAANPVDAAAVPRAEPTAERRSRRDGSLPQPRRRG